jgi:hypothetical protein
MALPTGLPLQAPVPVYFHSMPPALALAALYPSEEVTGLSLMWAAVLCHCCNDYVNGLFVLGRGSTGRESQHSCLARVASMQDCYRKVVLQRCCFD